MARSTCAVPPTLGSRMNRRARSSLPRSDARTSMSSRVPWALPPSKVIPSPADAPSAAPHIHRVVPYQPVTHRPSRGSPAAPDVGTRPSASSSSPDSHPAPVRSRRTGMRDSHGAARTSVFSVSATAASSAGSSCGDGGSGCEWSEPSEASKNQSVAESRLRSIQATASAPCSLAIDRAAAAASGAVGSGPRRRPPRP